MSSVEQPWVGSTKNTDRAETGYVHLRRTFYQRNSLRWPSSLVKHMGRIATHQMGRMSQERDILKVWARHWWPVGDLCDTFGDNNELYFSIKGYSFSTKLVCESQKMNHSEQYKCSVDLWVQTIIPRGLRAAKSFKSISQEYLGRIGKNACQRMPAKHISCQHKSLMETQGHWGMLDELREHSWRPEWKLLQGSSRASWYKLF